MMLPEKHYIKVGKLNRAFGLKGHLRFFIEPEMESRLKKISVFFIQNKNGQLPYFVDEFDQGESGHGMVHFEDVKDKTMADGLVGRILFVEETTLKKLKPATRLSDYIGFMIHDEHTGNLGLLDDIIQLPQHEIGQFIFEGKEILFPFNKEVVKKIDKRKKILFVDLPEGIIDVYLNKPQKEG
jgi:16S rRNA processing protein RimM